jgi:hypothetical protein
MKSDSCQLQAGRSMLAPLTNAETSRQFLRYRIRRIVKRRVRFLANLVRKALQSKDSAGAPKRQTGFEPLDCVRIKSREEIQGTLDAWNELKGCGFMEEMWQYCGSERRIFKHVERFLDERDYRVKKAKGVYLLEGLICQGTVDFGPCDRSCFFFWREEWLERSER